MWTLWLHFCDRSLTHLICARGGMWNWSLLLQAHTPWQDCFKRSLECISHLTIPDLMSLKYMTLCHLLMQKPPLWISPVSVSLLPGRVSHECSENTCSYLCPSSSLRLLAPLLRHPRRIQRHLYRTQASFPDEPGVLRVPDMPMAVAIRSRVEGQPLIWLWVLLFLGPQKMLMLPRYGQSLSVTLIFQLLAPTSSCSLVSSSDPWRVCLTAQASVLHHTQAAKRSR